MPSSSWPFTILPQAGVIAPARADDRRCAQVLAKRDDNWKKLQQSSRRARGVISRGRRACRSEATAAIHIIRDGFRPQSGQAAASRRSIDSCSSRMALLQLLPRYRRDPSSERIGGTSIVCARETLSSRRSGRSLAGAIQRSGVSLTVILSEACPSSMIGAFVERHRRQVDHRGSPRPGSDGG